MKNKVNINLLLAKPDKPFEKFHEKTKFKKMSPFIAVESWPKEWKTTYFKDYPRLDKIVLPSPSLPNNISLNDALWARQSSRYFSTKKVTIDQLSTLLYFSAGLKNNKPPWTSNRFYPSPGARYTLETYVISHNSDLPKGLYHYNLRSHSLEILLSKKIKVNHFFNQKWIYRASCIIFLTATFARNTIKYGDRGYRHVMQEAGHLGQNFYLNASVLGLSICAIGGYSENKIDKLLDLNSIKETVIYALAVGSKPKK